MRETFSVAIVCPKRIFFGFPIFFMISGFFADMVIGKHRWTVTMAASRAYSTRTQNAIRNLTVLLCVCCSACQSSNETSKNQPEDLVYRILGRVTLEESVAQHISGSKSQATLFLFLTKHCQSEQREPESLISEVQIPGAFPQSPSSAQSGVPFEFHAVKTGTYFLSAFVNVRDGGFQDSEYGTGDLVYFMGGEPGCVRVDLGEETSADGVEITLNHVVKVTDKPAFNF